MKVKLLLAMFVFTFISGCAGFQANKLPHKQSDRHDFQNQEKIKVYSDWEMGKTGFLVDPDIRVSKYENAFTKQVKKAGCCKIVEGPRQADLVVRGEAFDHSNAAALIPAAITGLTLYVIPSWTTIRNDMTIRVEKGERSKTYNLDDSAKLVQWLPMAFAFPFNGGPIKARKELDARTFYNLLVYLKEDGYI